MIPQEILDRIESLESTIEKLSADNATLRKLLYATLRPGVSRFDDSSAGQLFLFGNAPGSEDDAAEDEAPAPPVVSRKKTKPTGRQPLPVGLERVPDVVPVNEDDLLCACCDPPRETAVIRYEETEILEYKQAQLFVRVQKREVRACPSGMGGVTTAPLPPRVIEKGRAGVSLIVFVMLAKFIDHLPLHRVAKILKRSQVRIPESTLCDWVGAVSLAAIRQEKPR